MAPCPVLLLSGWSNSSWSVQSSSSLFLISQTCTTNSCQASLLSIITQVREHIHSWIQLARHLSKDTTVTGAWVNWNFLWWIIYLTHFCSHLVMKKYNFRLTKSSFKLVAKSSKQNKEKYTFKNLNLICPIQRLKTWHGFSDFFGKCCFFFLCSSCDCTNSRWEISRLFSEVLSASISSQFNSMV